LKETAAARRRRADRIDRTLSPLYPETTALHFRNIFELLIATILSAQCTDERVNRVTPGLFGKYPDAAAFASAPPEELEEAVHPTGFFRQKARSIKGCCEALVRDHGGRVPLSVDEMVQLPGVGRKTANMVLGNAEGVPGVVVDTHVKRVAHRLGLTGNTDPDRIEADLAALLPEDRWVAFSNLLIYLGRDRCTARKAKCDGCAVAGLCPRIGLEQVKG
jgi:endonuclease-3